jgi:hypothetical protein
MEIESLGPQALLVYTPLPELRRRGVDPRRPGVLALMLLAQEALERRGIPGERLEQLSALGEGGSLLLLLRLRAPREEWFPFPDLGRAVDAVAALSRPPEGPLVWDGRSYLLGTRSAEQAAALSEYTDPLSPAEAERSEAEGTLVLDEGAAGRLWGAMRGG